MSMCDFFVYLRASFGLLFLQQKLSVQYKYPITFTRTFYMFFLLSTYQSIQFDLFKLKFLHTITCNIHIGLATYLSHNTLA